MVSMRWQTEGLLEGSAEVVRTQTSKLRERAERNLLGQVLLDVGGDDPLLPGGEGPSNLAVAARHPAIEAHELMQEDDAEGLGIRTAFPCQALDRSLKLECRLPKRRIFEEQP